MAAIAVEKVTKVYDSGFIANDEVSLAVGEAEIFGLLGVNGAGKSTVVKQVVGLVRPTRGTVTVLGHEVRGNDSVLASLVGYMPQSAYSLNNLTVGEALFFTAHLRGASRSESRRLRSRVLEELDLGSVSAKHSSRLSGGQARLLQVAIAVVSRQPVLVLDEPTNELDPIKRRLVWEYLRRERAERGATILFITHDAAEAERVVDRVGFMKDGRLTRVGRPRDLTALADRPLRVEYTATTDGEETGMPRGFVRSDVHSDVCVAFFRPDEVVDGIARVPRSSIRSLRVSRVTVEELFVEQVSE